MSSHEERDERVDARQRIDDGRLTQLCGAVVRDVPESARDTRRKSPEQSAPFVRADPQPRRQRRHGGSGNEADREQHEVARRRHACFARQRGDEAHVPQMVNVTIA
jgi:hypothetical protein